MVKMERDRRRSPPLVRLLCAAAAAGALLVSGIVCARSSSAPWVDAETASPAEAEWPLKPVRRGAPADPATLEDLYERSWLRASRSGNNPCCLGSAVGLASSTLRKKKKRSTPLDRRSELLCGDAPVHCQGLERLMNKDA